MSANEGPQYFVRSMGKVVGPFGLEQLRKLRTQGRFGPGCEVSLDRASWRPWDSIDTTDPAAAARKTRAAEARESAAALAAASTQVVTAAEVSWHYSKNGQALGPVPQSQLESLIATGQLAPTDLVWSESLPDWQRLSDVPQLRPGQTQPGASTSTVATGSLRYANFWKRLAAQIFDQLILGVITSGFTVLLATVVIPADVTVQQVYILASIGSLVINWLYFAAMESSTTQATLGKLAIELRVVDMHGQRISFGRASGRFFGKILSGLMLGIGYLMIGMTPKRQAMHDLLTDCLVINHD